MCCAQCEMWLICVQQPLTLDIEYTYDPDLQLCLYEGKPDDEMTFPETYAFCRRNRGLLLLFDDIDKALIFFNLKLGKCKPMSNFPYHFNLSFE